MKNKPLANKQVPFTFFVILVISNLALLSLVGWLISQNREKTESTPDRTLPATPSSTENLKQETQIPNTPTSSEIIAENIPPTATSASIQQIIQEESVKDFLIFSSADGRYRHLYLYHPQWIPLTRLWDHPWEDITPAISPDGKKIAFSSNQNGYWDLYLYDFATGTIKRLTDTTQYDGSPSWSPDGEWIVYESYLDNNLELFILSANDPSQPPIRLTEHEAADFSPAWSSNGRQIAFVSTRSGDEEIWIANLDDDQNRFINFSKNPSGQDLHPSWSPDGNFLAWSSDQNGIQEIRMMNITTDQKPIALGIGDSPVWNPNGTMIFCTIANPNQYLIGAYSLTAPGDIAVPFFPISGMILGMDWREGDVLLLLANLKTTSPSGSPTPLWQPVKEISPDPPFGRYGIVPLQDVNVANPYLHDLVNESFNALRSEIAAISGWDFLGNLESAYLPITSPSPPEMIDNWLYTGRAFAINPLPMSADWMVISRQDFAGQTYWRLYLKARYQDGSQGLPLKERIWDLRARFMGDTRSYEEGGAYKAIPEGYWVDFTDIALRYGWERLPALTNWRTYYQGTRFNLFVLSDNLDWHTAMAQLYPPEAVMTITYVPTATAETIFTPTLTPTPRPTLTPKP